ncbi:rab-GTPase-TBC domain-containing protein [Sordaria brevicollis]|uniref:Rab-GTPase-TBC domain-containing protein n=1 Tax=Sordaria brevicollis TaxID=83679 RepID=A0AAE0PED5_SORBR|nr:rab-GTPase-TBC domain-containing protein [Sordaria brevicollis]
MNPTAKSTSSGSTRDPGTDAIPLLSTAPVVPVMTGPPQPAPSATTMGVLPLHPLPYLPPPSPATGNGTGNGTATSSLGGTLNGQKSLRRLQSAHSLGAKASPQPSLISQQRLQLQQQQQQSQHQPQSQPRLQPHQQLQHQLRLLPGPPSPPTRHASLNYRSTSQRGRANSDAPPVPVPLGQQYSTMAAANRRAMRGTTSSTANAMSLEKLLREGPPNGDVEAALESTRLKILDQGVKSDSDGMSSLRIYVWLILLNAPIIETDTYLALIHRGASPAYSKIRNDTFRTLTTDPLFRRRVSEASLIRLLNAVAWRLHDARGDRTRDHSIASLSRRSAPSEPGSRPGTSGHDSITGSPASKSRARALTLTTEGSEASGVASEPGTYVQGMNVLAAPFLYAARSEAEAFVAFHQLLTQELPGYIRGAMDGVHKGLALVDKVLSIVDPKLSLYLMSKNLSAEIYAFPSVLTLCACTPPLPEVLRLWDFLFAYGPHLNILCIVAQLIMIRTKIMESPSPNKLLRSFPALQADLIKRTTLTVIRMIPDDVYAEIVAHAK